MTATGAKMTRRQAASLTSGRNSNGGPTFFWVWMPYLYQRVAVPGRKHAFLPLNRDYLPLGQRRDAGYVNYDDVAYGRAVIFTRDPATFAGIWWNQDRAGRLWLYDDSVASRLDYFQRLEALMTRQMTMVTE